MGAVFGAARLRLRWPCFSSQCGYVVRCGGEVGNTWVGIAFSGHGGYTHLVRAGEQLTGRGASPVRLVVGDAAHTRLTYDDKPMALKPSSWPAVPLLRASLMIRTASITIPAEFGESQTSSLSSTLSGTSPNAEPSMRM